MEASLITLGQYLSVGSSSRIPSQEDDAGINQNCCKPGEKGPEPSINTTTRYYRAQSTVYEEEVQHRQIPLPFPYITARLC